MKKEMKYFREIGFRNMEQAIIFDIESASITPTIKEGEALYESWKYKMRNEGDIDIVQSFKEKSPLYAPFGRVVAISCGYVKGDEIKVKEYKGEDEAAILKEFFKDVKSLNEVGKSFLVGFSSIGYDMPFLAFRAMVNNVDIHPMFDVAHQKEWNLKYCIDLNLYLRGTSFTNMSLLNAAVAFGLPSPKQSLKGSEVSELFWSNGKNRMNKIGAYCTEDVLTTANILCKVLKVPLLKLSN